MQKIKLPLCLLLAVCAMLPLIFAAATPVQAISNEESLPLSAQSAVLMLFDGEKVIYEKDADRRLPMASTTKIMTALVALELCDPDTPVTVDASAIGTEGSSVYLVEGEHLTLEQLLYALLLESANDAAVAIAVACAGSETAFVEKMNEKATALGLCDTHFENPHGLDGETHCTTARELAKIACAALKNPLLRTIVSTKKTTIPHPDPHTTRLLVNHNKLLRIYDECIGVKTGYTQKSGRCLVSAAERDGVTLVAVTLDAPDDWDDHKTLLDHGFSRYTSRLLCSAGELLHPLPIVGGTDDYVMLANAADCTVTLPVGAKSVETRIECLPFEYATVTEGEKLATAVILCDTDGNGTKEEIARIPLYATYTVEKRKKENVFWRWLCFLCPWLKEKQ